MKIYRKYQYICWMTEMYKTARAKYDEGWQQCLYDW